MPLQRDIDEGPGEVVNILINTEVLISPLLDRAVESIPSIVYYHHNLRFWYMGGYCGEWTATKVPIVWRPQIGQR